MDRPYRDTRKIDPHRGGTLGNGSPNDSNRIEIGPTRQALTTGYIQHECARCLPIIGWFNGSTRPAGWSQNCRHIPRAAH